MQKIVLTNEGFNLLNTNHSEGQSQYWIGYYGLAYVPEGSALSANMTTLTPDGGDNIYNVFQGSMATTVAGVDTGTGNDAAYQLANECMYSANVMSRFRYVLDENDNNQLVIFADNRDLGDTDTSHSDGLAEYAVLRNADEAHVTVVGENATDDGITKVATLPLPAPLYYGGEPHNYSMLGDTLADSVTHDTRSYSSSSHAFAQGYGSGNPGINGNAPADADKYDYVASMNNTFSTDIHNVEGAILDKTWQLQSVSNFNRFHAPTNAEGYMQNAEPSCRNMAKATKLFPIDHYDVIGTTTNNTKVSAVKYTVNIDLRNTFDAISSRSTPYYQMKNGSLVEVPASTYSVGFKFNRIGIYAVQTSLHAYNTEEDAQEDCTKHHVQMQVIGESDPVLVAVMDLATPIVLSEAGTCAYSVDFQFNFTKHDSQLIDDASIYYNLYEDSAITWYKNQLIANASTADAVTSLGVQMAYLRQQMDQYASSSTSACGIVEDHDPDAVTSSGILNTVGIGDMVDRSTESVIFPYVDSTASGYYAPSYTKKDGSALLSAVDHGAGIGYRLQLGGHVMPLMDTSLSSNALLTYDNTTKTIASINSAGAPTSPIYINDDGVPTECIEMAPLYKDYVEDTYVYGWLVGTSRTQKVADNSTSASIDAIVTIQSLTSGASGNVARGQDTMFAGYLYINQRGRGEDAPTDSTVFNSLHNATSKWIIRRNTIEETDDNNDVWYVTNWYICLNDNMPRRYLKLTLCVLNTIGQYQIPSGFIGSDKNSIRITEPIVGLIDVITASRTPYTTSASAIGSTNVPLYMGEDGELKETGIVIQHGGQTYNIGTLNNLLVDFTWLDGNVSSWWTDQDSINDLCNVMAMVDAKSITLFKDDGSGGGTPGLHYMLANRSYMYKGATTGGESFLYTYEFSNGLYVLKINLAKNIIGSSPGVVYWSKPEDAVIPQLHHEPLFQSYKIIDTSGTYDNVPNTIYFL